MDLVSGMAIGGCIKSAFKNGIRVQKEYRLQGLHSWGNVPSNRKLDN